MVPDQEVDQRKLVQKHCQAHKLNMEETVDRRRWRKQIKDD